MSMTMTLKETVKQVTPAPLWRALHEWRHAEKCYWTWWGAAHAAGSYDSELLNRFRMARRQELPAAIADDHPLARALAQFPHDAEVEITDLGGSTGELIRTAQSRWPNARGLVVEHEGLVRLMAPEAGIRWEASIPAACDVFFTGGTLQYLSAPYATLDRGFKSARVAAVLTRNSFCHRHLIRVQHGRLYDNGSGPIPAGFSDQSLSYPHQTIDERRVVKQARKHGFKLVFETPEASGVQQYRGMVYGKQMIFLRDRD